MSDEFTAERAREAAQDLQNTVSGKISDAADAAKGVVQQTRAVAGSIGGMAQDTARQVANQATAAADTLSNQGGMARDYLARTVEENPLTAVLVAGAIGYAVACLLHRPS
ncbi:MAG TPA: hypothetical protein VHY35_05950 [Stellaceae bacterium]|jgi:ElaB/YqjD/DUF883 family membrane-anchored ribosome-binding protein|nr:hypothetical protein [Stellaceae bacterium]